MQNEDSAVAEAIFKGKSTENAQEGAAAAVATVRTMVTSADANTSNSKILDRSEQGMDVDEQSEDNYKMGDDIIFSENTSKQLRPWILTKRSHYHFRLETIALQLTDKCIELQNNIVPLGKY